jgi:hypothetical protein
MKGLLGFLAVIAVLLSVVAALFEPGYATYLAVLACAFVLIRKIGSE